MRTFAGMIPVEWTAGVEEFALEIGRCGIGFNGQSARQAQQWAPPVGGAITIAGIEA